MIFQGFRGFNFFQLGPIAYKTYITCDFPRGPDPVPIQVEQYF